MKINKKKIRQIGEHFLPDMSNDELINLRVQIDIELTTRGLSFNVGILGENLCIDYYNSTAKLPNLLKSATGAKNVDALSRDGERYSIKTFMKAKKTGTIYPDEKNANKQLFEYLLVVHLSDHYQLNAIYRYSWKSLKKLRAWDKRMNAWYLPLSQKNLKLGELVSSK